MVPRKDWIWLGRQGHFCTNVDFHLTTIIGDVIVSTVGEKEAVVSTNCDYETMVFPFEGIRDCGCCADKDYSKELQSRRYNTAEEAQNGHMGICEKWARKQDDSSTSENEGE